MAVHPYQGSRIAYRAELFDTDNDGIPAVVIITLYEGQASRGYQTNYTHVPTRWLEMEARHAETRKMLTWPAYEGATRQVGRRWCKVYSGKRFDKALTDYRKVVSEGYTETIKPAVSA